MVLFLSPPIFYPVVADDSDVKETLGSLSARIEELENQINGQGGALDDKNPGTHVTIEDLDRLRDEIRALKDARQNSSQDISHFQEELHSLRKDIRQLQKENSALRQGGSKKATLAVPDSPEKNERIASPTTPLEKDDETESLLKLLEQSAPAGEDDEDTKSLPRKKHDKNKDLEAVREMATKHAEEAAPALPTGNAEAQYNEAFALHDKGAYKEAERAFNYFIKTYPNDPLVPKAMYWKAESCLKQDKYKEAKILFVTAYKKNPKGPKAPDCLLKLGEVLAIQGKTEDACTAWLKLKTDFPHMTNDMERELKALKKNYGCKKISGQTSLSTPKP
jgi:tol-pal system protein YbgF